jgi:SAM-dependent methyltransferase
VKPRDLEADAARGVDCEGSPRAGVEPEDSATERRKGTGALTLAICRSADPAGVVGCDPAAAFIEHARDHARHEQAEYVVAGIGSLPSRDGGFSGVVSSLALNFFPDPHAALDEMRSRAAPNATIAACVWDYAGGMEFLRRFLGCGRGHRSERPPLRRGRSVPPLSSGRALRDRLVGVAPGLLP